MTWAEIVDSPKSVLSCQDVASVLNANAYTIHLQATDRPELLGFPVIVCGNRVKIPRLGFIHFMEGSNG